MLAWPWWFEEDERNLWFITLIQNAADYNRIPSKIMELASKEL